MENFQKIENFIHELVLRMTKIRIQYFLLHLLIFVCYLGWFEIVSKTRGRREGEMKFEKQKKVL